MSNLKFSPILLVANFVLRSRYKREIEDGNKIIRELNKYPKVIYEQNAYKWKIPEIFYEYPGVSGKNSLSLMGTVNFIKITP